MRLCNPFKVFMSWIIQSKKFWVKFEKLLDWKKKLFGGKRMLSKIEETSWPDSHNVYLKHDHSEGREVLRDRKCRTEKELPRGLKYRAKKRSHFDWSLDFFSSVKREKGKNWIEIQFYILWVDAFTSGDGVRYFAWIILWFINKSFSI